MSTNNIDTETNQNKENKTKRRRKPPGENTNKRRPIRLVSSLGEGKLLDRFQNAIMEKETKKKSRERGEKDRKNTKEKREREKAKFKAELDALLEDETAPGTKQKENKVYVPKLSGTVKGKFEALEQKKKEEEENKISNERQRRINRDFIEKKRIQIEIAQKKQKGLLNEEKEKPDDTILKSKKKPGKLKNKFTDKDRQRMDKENRKIEMEKQMKLSAELRAVKEYSTHKDAEDRLEDSCIMKKPEKTPKKLKTKFDDLLREREEKNRREVEKLKRKQLEEETQQMRAAKLAAQLSSSQDTNSESSPSLPGSNEILNIKPKRLSASFTKFDILERQRVEEERTRIRERRKVLLEEERKLFEESKLQQEQSDSDKGERSNESNKQETPGSLKSSLVNFDALACQKMEDERKRIQEERTKLLEEEKKNFSKQKILEDNNQSTESDSDKSDVEEKRKQRKKRKRLSRTPSKLANSKLRFDVLERERLENERLLIQKERQALLEEEKKLFERAKEEKESSDSNSEFEKDEASSTPGRLDGNRTKFDILTLQRMDEEREKIKNERNRLFEEEKRLMEDEKRKIQEIEDLDENVAGTPLVSSKKSKKPKRLDKSFTEFDILERQRVKKEEEKMYKEKAKKLDEEKKLFEEARTNMSSTDEEEEEDKSALDSSRKPNKLSTQLTKFDILERERIEEARLKSQKEKIERLEEELKLFQEQKRSLNQDSDDDITSSARELIKLSKKSPRPKKLSNSLTQFDLLERKRREEERVLLQQEKAHQLAQEREIFERSKHEEEQTEDVLGSEQSKTVLNSRPVKKMNVREKMEAVLKAQEEAEKKKIDETKFTRMTVEQQEIYLAKQRQIEFLKEQLAQAELDSSSSEDSCEDSEEDFTDEYDDDDDNYYYRYSDDDDDDDGDDDDDDEEDDEYTGSSNGREEEEEEDTSMCSESTSSSGSYSGSPYFVQTLKNLTVTEGDPVRFDANINANPHPKVTWYFKNRLIRNSPDYQYISKGTQYSIYMNESFMDDVGEYMCKAVNEKGSATSKAYLMVKETE